MIDTEGMMKGLFEVAARVSAVGAAAVVSVASASAPAKREVQKSTTITASYDDAWSALIGVFSERGWSIGNMEKDSGLITTEWMDLNSSDEAKFADCGGSGVTVTEGVQIKFNVRVESDDGVNVTVDTFLRALRSFGKQTAFVPCQSKGTVEALIHSEVGKRARARNLKVAKATLAPKPAADASQPRGYFCAASKDGGFCARQKHDCINARDAALATVADLSECTLTETAHCFDVDGRERCFPTSQQCTARAGEACRERK